MRLAAAIAKHLRMKLGRGGELEGVPAPIVTSIVAETLQALDDQLGDSITFPLASDDHEPCEGCNLIFEARKMVRDDEGVWVCAECAREFKADAEDGVPPREMP